MNKSETNKKKYETTIKYIFHGQAAHASSAPWEGRNAFNAAQLMFHAVDMLRQHCRPDAEFHGIIRKGGEAPNIVPELVEIEYLFRADDNCYLDELIIKADACAKGASIATQTSWEKSTLLRTTQK